MNKMNRHDTLAALPSCYMLHFSNFIYEKHHVVLANYLSYKVYRLLCQSVFPCCPVCCFKPYNTSAPTCRLQGMFTHNFPISVFINFVGRDELGDLTKTLIIFWCCKKSIFSNPNYLTYFVIELMLAPTLTVSSSLKIQTM